MCNIRANGSLPSFAHSVHDMEYFLNNEINVFFKIKGLG